MTSQYVGLGYVGLMLVPRLRRWPNNKSTYLTQINTVCVTTGNIIGLYFSGSHISPE